MTADYTIRVELVKPEEVESLENEISLLRAKCDKLMRDLHTTEMEYGYECRVNNELVDLCRSNGIPFRPALERAKR